MSNHVRCIESHTTKQTKHACRTPKGNRLYIHPHHKLDITRKDCNPLNFHSTSPQHSIHTTTEASTRHHYTLPRCTPQSSHPIHSLLHLKDSQATRSGFLLPIQFSITQLTRESSKLLFHLLDSILLYSLRFTSTVHALPLSVLGFVSPFRFRFTTSETENDEIVQADDSLGWKRIDVKLDLLSILYEKERKRQRQARWAIAVESLLTSPTCVVS